MFIKENNIKESDSEICQQIVNDLQEKNNFEGNDSKAGCIYTGSHLCSIYYEYLNRTKKNEDHISTTEFYDKLINDNIIKCVVRDVQYFTIPQYNLQNNQIETIS